MNKYLLLRDNRQSGPYSVDELAAHGLKAYDLVWLEGKSAAWRYPSEIEELKPFAPVTEEQPFDRFYKKPEPRTIAAAARDNTRVEKTQAPVIELKKSEERISSLKTVELSNGIKKIHVSLPVKNSTDSSTSKSSQKPIQSEPTPAYVNAQIENTTQPVAHDEPFSYAYKRKDSFSQQNFEEVFNQKQPANTNVSREAPVSKLLFRSVAAVCLLLGGALIGLIINYNSQQKKFQQLNQLVQEIKHQDNVGTSKTVQKDLTSDKAQIITPDPVEPAVEEPVYKEDIELPPAKKDRRNAKTKTNADSLAQIQATPEVVPAVVKSEESDSKIDKVASELAKKNLWQLVSVDHNAYKTGVFGGVSNLSLKISNKSLLQLKQVEIEILFLSPEKKTVNRQKVVFENVSPGEQLSIDVPKSSRGVKIEYSIKKITTKEFELAHAGL